MKKVLYGGRTSLEQAGLAARWWPHAVKHFCFSCNITEKDGDSPWNKRHQKGGFKGPLIPFGSLVDFLPSPTKGKAVAKFEPKAIPGIFVGYFLHPGGIWRGEFLCCPLSAFAEGGVAHTAGERFKPQRIK